MVDLLAKLDAVSEDKAAADNIRKGYKIIFNSDIGELVLQDMLWELYFLRPCTTPEQQALSNYAKTLIAKVYGQEVGYGVLKRFFRKLLKLKQKFK